MSAAYLTGTTACLPNAQFNCDRFHIVKLADEAMDEVCKLEWQTTQVRVQQALGELASKQRHSMLYGLRWNPSVRSTTQTKPCEGCSAPTWKPRAPEA